MRREGNVAVMDEVRSAYKILVGKPEGRRKRGRRRRRWRDNVTMYLREIMGIYGLDSCG
jgi:hypothetical protein